MPEPDCLSSFILSRNLFLRLNVWDHQFLSDPDRFVPVHSVQKPDLFRRGMKLFRDSRKLILFLHHIKRTRSDILLKLCGSAAYRVSFSSFSFSLIKLPPCSLALT